MYSGFDWFAKRSWVDAFYISVLNSSKRVQLTEHSQINLKCYTTCAATVNSISTTAARLSLFHNPVFYLSVPPPPHCNSTDSILFFNRFNSLVLQEHQPLSLHSSGGASITATNIITAPTTTAKNTTINSNATTTTVYAIPQN